MDFKLEIEGVEGEYTATLKTLDGETVSAYGATSVKAAQKTARALGAQYKSENRPHRLETYSEQFTL